jgi:hypothetical protein
VPLHTPLPPSVILCSPILSSFSFQFFSSLVPLHTPLPSSAIICTLPCTLPAMYSYDSRTTANTTHQYNSQYKAAHSIIRRAGSLLAAH